jgi:hypothetical protein
MRPGVRVGLSLGFAPDGCVLVVSAGVEGLVPTEELLFVVGTTLTTQDLVA